MRSAIALFALALLAPAAGAHDLIADWASPQGGDGRLAASSAAGPSSGHVAWTASFSTGSTPRASTPAIVDGRLYASIQRVTSSGENILVAYDLASGALLWEPKRLNNTQSVGLTYDPATRALFVPSNDLRGTIHRVGTDGTVAWSRTLDARVAGPPLVEGGRILALAVNGRVHALDAATGAIQWSAGDGKSTVLDVALARWGDTLLYPSLACPAASASNRDNDCVFAVAASDGAQRWTARPTDATTDDDLATTLAAVGGIVLAASKAATDTRSDPFPDNDHPAIPGRLFALDAQDGRVRWTKEATGATFFEASVSAGVVYAASTDGKLHAFDLRTGQVKWGPVPVANLLGTGPVVAGGAIYIGSVDEVEVPAGGQTYKVAGTTGRIHARSTADGRELWSQPVTARPYGGLAVAEGRLGFIGLGASSTVSIQVLGAAPGAHAANQPPTLASFDPPQGGAFAGELRWTASDPDAGDPLTFDVDLGASSLAPDVNLLALDRHAPLAPVTQATTWRVTVRDSHGATLAGPTLAFGSAISTTGADLSTTPPSVPPGSPPPKPGKNPIPGLDAVVTALAALALAAAWRRA